MSLTLAKQRLQGVRREKEDYSLLDLSSARAEGSIWMGCTFTDCDLTLANFQGAEFFDCTFKRCDFRAANFRTAKMRHVGFEECDMRQSAFVVVTPMEEVVFLGCKLQYASFYDSTVRGLQFLDSNLHGTDLRFIEASGCRYIGSNLWSAVVGLGCNFFNGEFDERSCDLFMAMVGRVHPNPEKARILKESAGDVAVKVADRLMNERTA